jgi:hypothetical protein
MNNEHSTRRRFLVAAITFGSVAASLPGISWLGGSAAWASGDALTSVLVQMARLLFPHDGLADDTYAGVMGDVLAAAANDAALSSSLDAAAAALDFGQDEPWLLLGKADQFAVMQGVQDETFFIEILASVRQHFYYDSRVWKYLDYPGSSKEYGGYINRGFDDINWLTESR